MALASRSLRITGISARSFLLMGVVIALVVALFFIPEIINFQKSLNSPAERELARSDFEKLTAPVDPLEGLIAAELGTEPPKTAPEAGSPLGEITKMLDTNFIDQVKAKKVVQSRAATEPLPELQRIAWDTIRGKGSADVLRATEKETIAIAKGLPNKFSATRFALFNFSNAIRLALSGAENTMTPVEAVHYVEYSRLAVTRAMMREDVERAVYNRWVGLSLGSVIDQFRGFDRTDIPRTFNPEVTLTWVSMFKPGNNHGRWVERSPVYLNFRGYVIGKDVKNIEFYLNGNKIGRTVPLGADHEGKRTFRFGQGNGRGVYTIRVYDKFGQIYEKHYRFYPRVRWFPWKRGGFRIPQVEEGDKRLDRYFTFRRGSVVGVSSPGFFDAAEMVRF